MTILIQSHIIIKCSNTILLNRYIGVYPVMRDSMWKWWNIILAHQWRPAWIWIVAIICRIWLAPQAWIGRPVIQRPDLVLKLVIQDSANARLVVAIQPGVPGIYRINRGISRRGITARPDSIDHKRMSATIYRYTDRIIVGQRILPKIGTEIIRRSRTIGTINPIVEQIRFAPLHRVCWRGLIP